MRNYYDSFGEYLKSAQFHHYEVSYRSDKDYFIQGYDVTNDPDFYMNRDYEIKYDGGMYYKVNFGEEEESYMLVGESGYMYFVYFGDCGSCLGTAYSNIEDAINSIEKDFTYEII